MQDERLHLSTKSNVVPIIGHGTQASEPDELISRNFEEFLAHKYPPRENVLAPWLPARGIAMIAGWRGLGKTYVGLACAYAIATGGSVLGWKAVEPRKVLYVDGEMDPADLQERIAAIHAAAVRDKNGNPELAAANLKFLCDGDQSNGMPDLNTHTGRQQVEKVLARCGAEVLMLDNISALFRDCDASESEAESWIAPQDWLRKLRREGKTTVLFHHAGKPDAAGNTKQRGTSKREDVLNTSILLEPPKQKGVSFVINFTKHRGFVPTDKFAVAIKHEAGECRLELPDLEKAILFLAASEPSMTQTEIAEQLHTNQSKVSRTLAKRYGGEAGGCYAG
jgi:RecA-family ATPase